MDESREKANPQVRSVAVRIPSAMSLDAPDGPWVAARLVEVDPTSIAVDTEGHEPSGPKQRSHRWQAAVGTLIIVLVLLATSIICLLCLRRIGSWDRLSDDQRSLTRFVVWCYYAATVGVIARWLTLAAVGLPTPTYNLAEYLRRWLADAVSSALIVTVTLMVLRSVSVQMGTVTLALSGASQDLVIGVGFVLGYFTRRARRLLYGISHLTFLQRPSAGEAQRSNGYEKDDFGDHDLPGASGDQ